jgi:hypothetical protein
VSEAPNLIDLLSREQPAALASLRAHYPSEAKIFSSERLLGDTGPGNAPQFNATQRSAILDLISTSVSTCANDLDALANAIRETMKRVARIRYGGSLIASISGGLAGVLAIALSNALIQAITAFLAMLGGIAAATAEQFERAPSGVRIASVEEYGKLIEMRANIEIARTKLQRDKILPLDDQDLRNMLAELDKYAASLIRLKMA